MGIKGEPAPNTYSLPATLGFRRHDPTLWKAPAYTLRVRHHEDPSGLGPGLYRVRDVTRFGPSRGPATTMAKKVPDLYDYTSPGPVHYRPEKCYLAKQNPPKYTMAKRTPLVEPSRGPAPNTYRLPPTLGPRVPDKHCNGAYTMGVKAKTPRGEGVPAPNKYGPVRPSCYKPASARYTMRPKPPLPRDKTTKPAPNCYRPRPLSASRRKAPSFTMSSRDRDARVVYLTRDDVRQ